MVEAKQEVLKSLAAEVPVGGSAAGELEEPLPAMSPKYAESGLERAIRCGRSRQGHLNLIGRLLPGP